jgi:hypothetical protein
MPGTCPRERNNGPVFLLQAARFYDKNARILLNYRLLYEHTLLLASGYHKSMTPEITL